MGDHIVLYQNLPKQSFSLVGNFCHNLLIFFFKKNNIPVIKSLKIAMFLHIVQSKQLGYKRTLINFYFHRWSIAPKVAKSPCGGVTTIMATSQNWDRHNTTIEKTRFYTLWSNKILLWIVLHSSRPKALGVDNYKLFDFFLYFSWRLDMGMLHDTLSSAISLMKKEV